MLLILFYAYAAYLVVMNIVDFVMYGVDKKKAKRGAWRIPEATLLGVGFLGGAVGGLAAMRAFRHKTKHWYFWVINVLGIVWQIGLLAVLVGRLFL